MKVEHNGREIDLSWGELFFSGNIHLIYKGEDTKDKIKRFVFSLFAVLANLLFCIPKLIADRSINQKHMNLNLLAVHPVKEGSKRTPQ